MPSDVAAGPTCRICVQCEDAADMCTHASCRQAQDLGLALALPLSTLQAQHARNEVLPRHAIHGHAVRLTSETTRPLPPSASSTAMSRRAQNRCWWKAATTCGATIVPARRSTLTPAQRTYHDQTVLP